MQRLTGQTLGGGSLRIPAGVTQITVTPVDSSGFNVGGATLLAVVPNTTYTCTIISSSFILNFPNTFGSLYSWSGSGYLSVQWVE